jgi:putative endonuclease
VAARYLTELGMAVVARNWRCRDGEIDIVALDGDVVVVCEVKTRSGTRFEHPLAAVGPVKAERLRRLAGHWAGPGTDVRVDLVAVVHHGRGAARLDHVRGVC